MTLDDEAAANLARGVVGGGKAACVYPHSTDVALVRAGYAARDAEVEELRAERAQVIESYEAGIRQAEAQRDSALATLAKVREAVSGHPFAECPEHPDDDVVTCGWKRAYADVLAALDESPTEREGAE